MSGFSSAVRAGWELAFQVNPLYLTGGSFANAPGGIFSFGGLAGALLGPIQGALGSTIPFVALPSLIAAEGLGALGSGEPWMGLWIVLPGGKMVSQSVATYPFASQKVAANATVQEPLTLSLMLRAPVKDGFGYPSKFAILNVLKATLTAHNNAGGTYTVFTPGILYEDGLLLDVFDATDGETKQEQVDWQFDFYFPLISRASAAAALSNEMAKLAGQQQIQGAPSWASLGQ